MRVVWTERALAHIDEIEAFIARENPPASVRVGAALERLVERISAYPQLGKPRGRRIREAVEPRFRYVVRYMVLPDHRAPDRVVILTIRHPKRRR